MVTFPRVANQPIVPLSIIWNSIPDNVPLEAEPVENSDQSALAVNWEQGSAIAVVIRLSGRRSCGGG
ncbi:hypothetical protein IQ265_26965 [Nodosilinea sp. LEGE 06152]|uniref:hypothetical protein n=1 Tax=Nodosilinea sp. LEGE 06152 TaxID=2777966 RepID=UPI00188213F7|nr:hypothetical protein [Nodosilinea sp. LEGE 06152]MBE9160435.1 hypothetical protein [Nodosilinea sp. LEGE 06152]